MLVVSEAAQIVYQVYTANIDEEKFPENSNLCDNIWWKTVEDRVLLCGKILEAQHQGHRYESVIVNRSEAEVDEILASIQLFSPAQYSQIKAIMKSIQDKAN